MVASVCAVPVGAMWLQPVESVCSTKPTMLCPVWVALQTRAMLLYMQNVM